MDKKNQFYGSINILVVKIYNDYILKYYLRLNNFYFEKSTTVEEAFSILSNYEFKLIFIIINDKLSEEFFSLYDKNIKKLGVVTANIILNDGNINLNNNYINDPFLNPGKVVDDFSKVVEYLNKDENGFENILKLKKTIDQTFTGNYGNIFKKIEKKHVVVPIKMIQKLL